MPYFNFGRGKPDRRRRPITAIVHTHEGDEYRAVSYGGTTADEIKSIASERADKAGKHIARVDLVDSKTRKKVDE